MSARKNPPISKAPETSIRDGMARALWISAYISFVTERMGGEDEWPSPRDANEDWNDVAPETPPVAIKAAKDLIKLYARAEGTSEDETMSLLFETAAQVDTGVPLEHDVDAEYQYTRPVPKKQRGKTVGEVAYDFGYGLAMSALGEGVGWGDDHRERDDQGRRFDAPRVRFETSFDGTDLSWSGRGDQPEVVGGRETTSGLEGPGVVTERIIRDEDGDELRRQRVTEVPIDLTDEETVRGLSLVDKAVQWLHEHIGHRGYQEEDQDAQGLYYDVTNATNGDDDEVEFSYHLVGFSLDQQREISERMEAEAFAPEPTQIGRITVVNPDERRNWDRRYTHRFVFWFGQGDAAWLMAYAHDEDEALEMCVDWIVEHAPGRLADEQVEENFKELVKEYKEKHPGEEPTEEEMWQMQDEAASDTTSFSHDGIHYLGVDEYGMEGGRDPGDRLLEEIAQVADRVDTLQRDREWDARMAHHRAARIWRAVVPGNYAAVPSPDPTGMRHGGGEGVETFDFGQPSPERARRAARFLLEEAPLEARWNTGGAATSFSPRSFYLSPIVGGQRMTFALENFTIEEQNVIWDELMEHGAITDPETSPMHPRHKKNPSVRHARR